MFYLDPISKHVHESFPAQVIRKPRAEFTPTTSLRLGTVFILGFLELACLLKDRATR